MIAGKRDAGQHVSDGTALLLTAGFAAILFTTSSPNWFARAPDSPNSQGIELSVESAPTPPAPPLVSPPVPVRHTMTPRAVAPAPVALRSEEEQAAPEDAALVAAGAPAVEQPASNSHADIEAEYAAQLHANIDRRTRPPDSAQYRLRRPTGEVRVRFVVTRNGVPRGSSVVHSSGSSMLDEAALTIVAAGQYAPMPATAFAGESEHAFTVTIEFRPATLILGAR